MPSGGSIEPTNLSLSDMEALLQPVARAAQFKLEPQRKRMLVFATEDEHQKMEATLAILQKQPNSDYKQVVVAYPVNRGDASSRSCRCCRAFALNSPSLRTIERARFW